MATNNDIKTLELSAKKGNKEAAAQLNALGLDFQYGNNGQKVDLAQALHFYTIAAECGNPDAMCNAAYCYFNGIGTDENPEKAFMLYKKAAEAGNRNGMTNLWPFYFHGFGTKQDTVEAIKWLIKAIDAGNYDLQEALNQVFASLSPADSKKLKQSNEVTAQYKMAEFYLENQAYEDAISWYVQSIKSGNKDAIVRMMTLAEDFRHGNNGRKENLSVAYQFYFNAAECGDIIARTKVAYCICNGIGVEKDPKRAFSLYEQLAKEGNEKGMSNLGMMYCNGMGVQKDIQKAIYWSTRAAEELNSVNAMNTLIHIFGTEKDYISYAEAIKWLCIVYKKDSDPNSGYYHCTHYDKALTKQIVWTLMDSLYESNVPGLMRRIAESEKHIIDLFDGPITFISDTTSKYLQEFLRIDKQSASQDMSKHSNKWTDLVDLIDKDQGLSI